MSLHATVPECEQVCSYSCATARRNCQLASPACECAYNVNAFGNFVVGVGELDSLFFWERFLVRSYILHQTLNVKSIGRPNSDDDCFGFVTVFVCSD
jgi:hypothetical protein